MITIAYMRLKLIKNKSSILWMLVAPILFLTLIINGFEGTESKTLVKIVDQDQTELSKELIRFLSEDREYEFESCGMAQAKEALVEGTAIAAIVIPANYSDMLKQQKEKPSLSLIKLRDNSRLAAVESHLTNVFNRQRFIYNIGKIAEQGIKQAGTPVKDTRIAQEVQNRFRANSAKIGTSITIDQRADGDDDSLSYGTIGIMVMFILFFMVNSAGVLVDERTSGILDRIRTTELNPLKVAAGQILGLVLAGMIQVLILFLFGRIAFGIDWGNSFPGLALLLLSYLFSAASLGTLISSFSRNRRQFAGLMAIVVVPTSLLGGCMWSADMMSEAMATAAKFVPQNWAIEGLVNLATRQSDATGAVLPCVVLCGFSVLFCLLSYIKNLYDTKS